MPEPTVTFVLSNDARGVLSELHAYAEIEDALARERVRVESTALGAPLSASDKYEIYGDAAPLAISPSEGEVLYFLVRLLRPQCVGEFGSSHGISTIYLAAALDRQRGRSSCDHRNSRREGRGRQERPHPRGIDRRGRPPSRRCENLSPRSKVWLISPSSTGATPCTSTF